MSLISIPFFGWLSDRFGRRRVYAAGIILTGAFAFPYYALLNSKSAGLILLAIVISLVCHDLQYGPQGALIAESFEPDVRYSASGLGYQLASVVAGGPAPLIAAALLAHYGNSSPIVLYILGCAVVSLLALVLLPRRRTADDGVSPTAAAAGPESRKQSPIPLEAVVRPREPVSDYAQARHLGGRS